MESNDYKGTKTDFVRMALQYKMPKTTLTLILKDLAPTLNETREIICILLKELEALQLTLKKKDKELDTYRKGKNSEDYQNIALELEPVPNIVQENEQQSTISDIETLDDEIEVLEVVKESMNEACK